MVESPTGKGLSLRRLWPYVVAAIMIVYVAVLLFLIAADVQKMNALLESL